MLRSGSVKTFLNRLARPAQGAAPESGLTLIECLVAIIIIGLTVGAVTPALVISVASRVQSQKANQALEIAQGEIDQVRTLIERGDYTLTELNASVPFVSVTGTITYSTAAQVPVPTNNPVPTADYDTYTETKQIDYDGDGENDYAAQVFRVANNADASTAFTMGVRVYDYDAALDANNLGSDSTDTARLGVTGSRGERDRLPLASLYTSIVRGEDSNSLCDYIEYLTNSTPDDDYSCN
ncbi:prepilin-type N-terminal cleavage/methylation domain-containing protein [Sphaerothrix gracilis]|uniref:prepilin-type N-terminal cleavage/methylation domain-containing protein n=1 Tax=Sphaerothrix gracilis TaxID=3151835 RepID=UPI0031FD501C